MSVAEIVLVGAGGHARSCIDVVEREARYSIVGIIGEVAEIGGEVLGYPVVGSDDALATFGRRGLHALVTVGQIKSSQLRMRLFSLVEEAGLRPASVISPFAVVSRHATVGDGTIVMHGAVINAGAAVGRNCIINSHALIEHDAVIEDHCHVSTGAIINGAVRVGACSFIGSGSVVRQETVIGHGCVIGMGQMVLADCAPGSRRPAFTESV